MICLDCKRELPETNFRMGRFNRNRICQECINACRRERKQAKIEALNNRGKDSDELFDGKEPREVINIMSRAKKWLEARDYTITLKGEYVEKKKVRF